MDSFDVQTNYRLNDSMELSGTGNKIICCVHGFFVCLKYLFCTHPLEFLEKSVFKCMQCGFFQARPLGHPSISSNLFKHLTYWSMGLVGGFLFLFSCPGYLN